LHAPALTAEWALAGFAALISAAAPRCPASCLALRPPGGPGLRRPWWHSGGFRQTNRAAGLPRPAWRAGPAWRRAATRPGGRPPRAGPALVLAQSVLPASPTRPTRPQAIPPAPGPRRPGRVAGLGHGARSAATSPVPSPGDPALEPAQGGPWRPPRARRPAVYDVACGQPTRPGIASYRHSAEEAVDDPPVPALLSDSPGCRGTGPPKPPAPGLPRVRCIPVPTLFRPPAAFSNRLQPVEPVVPRSGVSCQTAPSASPDGATAAARESPRPRLPVRARGRPAAARAFRRSFLAQPYPGPGPWGDLGVRGLSRLLGVDPGDVSRTGPALVLRPPVQPRPQPRSTTRTGRARACSASTCSPGPTHPGLGLYRLNRAFPRPTLGLECWSRSCCSSCGRLCLPEAVLNAAAALTPPPPAPAHLLERISLFLLRRAGAVFLSSSPGKSLNIILPTSSPGPLHLHFFGRWVFHRRLPVRPRGRLKLCRPWVQALRAAASTNGRRCDELANDPKPEAA